MSQEQIYNLESVAELCGVTRETVVSWIERGLRAFQLGSPTKYRPRDYLIRQTWLIDFLDAHSRVSIANRDASPETAPETIVPRRERPRRPARANDDLIGPRPV
ncbi:MAG: hypothetical protein KGR26_07240 [Cyanobacteria bacterium REEB65]|nr:hypothetical protein [Cyanobacteria bacterium REEB65]